MSKEKIRIFADSANVQKIVSTTEKLLIEMDSKVLDVMTALVVILIGRSQQMNLSKPSLLAYISNTWELNDPETDLHELRSESPKINY